MRYVITENQQEKVIQSLIDNSFNRRRVEINRLWGDMTEEGQEDHFSYHQSLNQIEKLKIDELQTDNGEWTVYLDAYMKSTWNPMDDSYDFDDLFDALGEDLSKFLGVEVFVPLNRKIDYKEGITEMIKLDIKVGDTIMGGKFKNKKVVVKTIGKNEKGDVTINGKPLLRFRILKEDDRQNKFQKLIDGSLSILKEKCDDQEERGADAEEIVNFEACDELSSTNEVKVVDYKIDKGIIVLFLNFHVESIRYQNIDNLIWELQYQVQTLTGKGSVKLVHNDTINKRLNESDEPKHKTVTKFERMLKPALEMLNKMSEGWDVHNYTFDEMSLTDGETTPLSYETNLHVWTNSDKIYNRLQVSSNLLSTMEGFFPLIDEYVIMDWFNEKYNRTATEVEVYDEEY
jgi:hypothetical protein